MFHKEDYSNTKPSNGSMDDAQQIADLLQKDPKVTRAIQTAFYRHDGKSWFKKWFAERIVADKVGIVDQEVAYNAGKLVVEDKQEQVENDYDERDMQFLATLYPFQKENLEFMVQNNGRVLLGDEMGLGKTLSSLAYICKTKQTPALVICPKSLKFNWHKEILNAVKINGNAPSIRIVDTDRFDLQTVDLDTRETRKADFVIANYERVRKQVVTDKLKLWKKRAVILDEAHKIKNYRSQQTKAINEICRDVAHVIALSGTPLLSHGVEIYNVVRPVAPNLFGSWKNFERNYCFKTRFGSQLKHNKYDELKTTLYRTFIRHKKEDVLKDLPSKQIITQPVDFDYMGYEKWARKEIQERAKEERDSEELLGFITKERKHVGMMKADSAAKFAENILQQDESVLLFAHHKDVISELQNKLNEYKPKIIVGGQNEHERNDAVESFQNGDTKLLIGSITAAGLGLNLTASRYAVTAELDWTPANHWQAEDRIHRIGQENNVTIYYLIAFGTLDDMLVDTITKKEEMFNKLIEKDGNKNQSIISNPELKQQIKNRIREFAK